MFIFCRRKTRKAFRVAEKNKIDRKVGEYPPDRRIPMFVVVGGRTLLPFRK